MLKKTFTAHLALLALLSFNAALYAQDRAAAVNTARSLMKKHDKAVVKVRAVSQTSTEGFGMVFGNKDQVTVATALFIEDSGLAILPYSAIKANSGVQIRVQNVGGEEREIRPKEEFKSFDFVLADNSRVPAKIVITDPELDIAIVAPEKPLDEKTKAKLSFVSLDSNPEIALLDYIVVLDRMSTTLNSQTSVGVTRVQAVVSKPRTMYVAGVGTGSLCFNEKGEFVGVGAVIRSSGEGLFGASAETIILPAKYIREVVEQAKTKLAQK